MLWSIIFVLIFLYQHCTTQDGHCDIARFGWPIILHQASDCNLSSEWRFCSVQSQNYTDSLCRHKYEDISDSLYYNDWKKWVQQCNSVWLLRWLSGQIFKSQESTRKYIAHKNKTHFVYIYGPTFCLIFNFEKIDDRQILCHKHQYRWTDLIKPWIFISVWVVAAQ